MRRPSALRPPSRSLDLAGPRACRIRPPTRSFGVVHDRLQNGRFVAEDFRDVLVLDHDPLERVELDLVEFAALRTESDRKQRDLRIWRLRLSLHRIGLELQMRGEVAR